MKVEGDYQGDGYAALRNLVPAEVTEVFLRRLKQDMDAARIPMQRFAQTSEILSKNAVEIYGYQYRPMVQFLWGLTPAISLATGRDLLPTYNYFRLYQRGDICRVHSDRASCEHSLSLTLAYSDGEPWALDIGKDRIDDTQPIEDGFGDAAFSSILMQPGDGSTRATTSATAGSRPTRTAGRPTCSCTGWTATAPTRTRPSTSANRWTARSIFSSNRPPKSPRMRGLSGARSAILFYIQ